MPFSCARKLFSGTLTPQAWHRRMGMMALLLSRAFFLDEVAPEEITHESVKNSACL